jgi:Zn-dependent protease with chaperone function
MKLAAVAIAGLLALPARAAERCPVPDIDGMRGRFGGGVPAGEDPVCAAAVSYFVPLRALEAAAGFAPGSWGLAIQRFSAMENVYLAEGAKVIVVTAPFLARFGAASPAALFTLAHELGHAVQRREDPTPWDPAEPEDAQNRRSRRLEAHADALAYALLARAGHPFGLHEAGLRALYPADAFLDDRPSATPHPSAKVRLSNALRLARGDYAAPRLEDFDDDGRLR